MHAERKENNKIKRCYTQCVYFQHYNEQSVDKIALKEKNSFGKGG